MDVYTRMVHGAVISLSFIFVCLLGWVAYQYWYKHYGWRRD